MTEQSWCALTSRRRSEMLPTPEGVEGAIELKAVVNRFVASVGLLERFVSLSIDQSVTGAV